MENNNTLSNNFFSFFLKSRKRNILLLIFLLLLLLLISIILRKITPKTENTIPFIPQPKITSFNSTLRTDTQVIKSFPSLQVPQTMRVYQISSSIDPAVFLREKEGLKTAKNPGVWVDTSGKKRLAVDPYTRRYNYTMDVETLEGSLIPLDSALTESKSFLTNSLNTNNLTPMVDKARFWTDGGGHFEETTSEKATIISIPFSLLIDEIPVFFEDGVDYPVEIYVNNKKEVVRADFPLGLISVISIGNVPTRSIDRALQELSNATVIQASYDFLPIPLQSLTSIEITLVTLENRGSQQSNNVVPYYRFYGKATTKDKKSLELQFVIPAVVIKENSQ